MSQLDEILLQCVADVNLSSGSNADSRAEKEASRKVKELMLVLIGYDTQHSQFCRKRGEMFRECHECWVEKLRQKVSEL